MSRIVLIFIFLSISSNINAQTYKHMPLQTGTVWTGSYWFFNGMCGCTVFNNYKIIGDSIVNNVSYKKIILENGDCSCNWSIPQNAGLVREDTIAKKVYLIPINSNSEVIIYDFTQNVGDTVNSFLSCGNQLVIQSIDSISINGLYHKRFNISDCGVGTSFIEGVGNTQGFLQSTFSFEFGGILNCIIQGDSVLFVSGLGSCFAIVDEVKDTIPSLSLFPNPIIQSLTINCRKFIKQVKIFNQVGEFVLIESPSSENVFIDLQHLKRGIYFVEIDDGKEIHRSKIIKQ